MLKKWKLKEKENTEKTKKRSKIDKTEIKWN